MQTCLPVDVIRLQGRVSPNSLTDLLKGLMAPVTCSPHHGVRDLALAALVESLHSLKHKINEVYEELASYVSSSTDRYFSCWYPTYH